MRALQINEYGGTNALTNVTREVPTPKKGQVLIKVAAAACNPSDLAFLDGNYGIVKKVPVIPGFVGSGTVVASGGGIFANYLNGKRVACSSPVTGQGTWAEYMVSDANGCIPLRKNVDFEFGANMIVNPLTAVALLDLARRNGHKAVVQNAAASALGQMIIRLARTYGLPTINLVRRAEQVELLKNIGAEVVINTAEDGWEKELKRDCNQLNATVAFDAIAGEMTEQMAAVMPFGSTVTVYGGLSGEASMLSPASSIFRGQTVNGFWLTSWLGQKKIWDLITLSNRVQGKLKDALATPIRQRYGLEQAIEGIKAYETTMTAGKILITPGK